MTNRVAETNNGASLTVHQLYPGTIFKYGTGKTYYMRTVVKGEIAIINLHSGDVYYDPSNGAVTIAEEITIKRIESTHAN